MRLKKRLLWALIGIVVGVSPAFAAERSLGASAAMNQRSQAQAQAAANLGAGGPGPDLRAISTPRQQPRSLTGLPAGTFSPGVGGGSANAGDEDGRSGNKAAFAGDPLPPIIGPELLGVNLDGVYAVADHAGYSIVQRSYNPTTLDAAYVFHVLERGARRYILHFDRSAKLLRIEFYDPWERAWVKWPEGTS